MPLSVRGGQLPLSSFFGSSGSFGKRPTKPRVPSKRKDSPVRAQPLEPPKKKRKQKENVTPSCGQALADAVQQGTSKAHHRPSSTTDMEVEENSTELAYAPQVNARLGDASIDFAVDRPGEVIAASPSKHAHNLETTPLAPEFQDHCPGFDNITSLPSPPLTAPDVRRVQKKRDDGTNNQEDFLELPQATSLDRGVKPGHHLDKVVSSGTPSQTHAVKHNIPCPSKPSQRCRDLMPPPPLPLKALLLSPSPPSSTEPMPCPAQFCRPRSVSSETWVPSSQTQELSIPRWEDIQDDQSSGGGHCGRAPQVVPSSQLSEREFEVLLHTSDHRDAREPSSSSVMIDGRGGPALPSTLSAPTAMDGDLEESVVHETVESSQSQFETEITAAWAETLAVRQESLRWSRKQSLSLPSSSPPRAIESQDYDAQSEWSSSIDKVSQSLTMDPRTSPLVLPSRPPSIKSSGSHEDSDSASYSLPSQIRRFLETFEGRDEGGNVLPRDYDASLGRSWVSSCSQDRGWSPCRRVHTPSQGRRQTCFGAITASPPTIPQDYASDGGSPYGSSLPPTMPTPLRNFLEMFPDTQTQDLLGVEPSQG